MKVVRVQLLVVLTFPHDVHCMVTLPNMVPESIMRGVRDNPISNDLSVDVPNPIFSVAEPPKKAQANHLAYKVLKIIGIRLACRKRFEFVGHRLQGGPITVWR